VESPRNGRFLRLAMVSDRGHIRSTSPTDRPIHHRFRQGYHLYLLCSLCCSPSAIAIYCVLTFQERRDTESKVELFDEAKFTQMMNE
jgi:hypothetical protein